MDTFALIKKFYGSQGLSSPDPETPPPELPSIAESLCLTIDEVVRLRKIEAEYNVLFKREVTEVMDQPKPIKCHECSDPHVTVFDGFPLCGEHAAKWWSHSKNVERDLLRTVKTSAKELAKYRGHIKQYSRESDRMAAAICVAMYSGVLGSRSEAADAMLDYCDGEPWSREKAWSVLNEKDSDDKKKI